MLKYESEIRPDYFIAIEEAMLNNVHFEEVISLLSSELQDKILSKRNHLDIQSFSKESTFN
ncbi:hypothetical protein ACFLY2_00190 [Patescibacteria group bacterium]